MADDRYASMDMMGAERECGKSYAASATNCPKCAQRVILHCVSCKIQVTGCICTEVDRFGNAEAIDRIISRFGEEEGVRRLKAAGFWIPKELGENNGS